MRNTVIISFDASTFTGAIRSRETVPTSDRILMVSVGGHFSLPGTDYLATPDIKDRNYNAIAHAINLAQTFVDTPYVSYLKAGDTYTEDHSKLADYLDENPSIGCVYGRQTVSGKDEWTYRDLDHDKTAGLLKTPGPRPVNPINHNTFMHRSNFFANWSTDPDDTKWADYTAVRSLLDQGCRFQEIDVITGELCLQS